MKLQKTISGHSEPKPASDSRRDFMRKASLGGLAMGLFYGWGKSAETNAYGDSSSVYPQEKTPSKIIITDLKATLMGTHVVVRIATNAGISGYAMAEPAKNWLKPYVMFYKDYVVGMDPTDVARIMLKIRRLGGFKPWGAAVSSIEMALWDVAGKAAGVPVYKLLGGKIRDYVRPYGRSAEGPEGFTIVKMGLGFHGGMASRVPNFFYGSPDVSPQMSRDASNPYGYNAETKTYRSKSGPYPNKGLITEQGMNAMIRAVEERKKQLGDGVGLAADVGPGMTVTDSIRLAKALEPYNLLWLEDMITGDYHPYVLAELYREVTQATTTPIHTGEQLYLRENCRELIETRAVSVLGPDPADVGGIAEMKWIAEYADLHSVQIAPHGIGDGVFGLAAQVQAGCTMPENYIAFEYPGIRDQWWFDITEGLPDPIVQNGFIKVWDRPGIGVDFIVKEAKKYLPEEDKNFFD